MNQYTVEISRQAVKAIAGLERADQMLPDEALVHAVEAASGPLA